MRRAFDPNALLFQQRAQWAAINPLWAAKGPELQLTSRGTATAFAPTMSAERTESGSSIASASASIPPASSEAGSDGEIPWGTIGLVIGGALLGGRIVRGLKKR